LQLHLEPNAFHGKAGQFPDVLVGKRVGLAAWTPDNAGQSTAEGNPAMPATDTRTHLPPTFNRLAWSNLAAQSAEQIALAAAPIVAVIMLGVGEGQTGLLQTALTLPFILFAIPAGLLADRISRAWLMAGSEGFRAAALFGILALIWLDLLTLPLLALLGFVAVCGTVAYSVAAPALVPSLVTPELLPAANARIELARTVAFASGPALGGVLVGWMGAAPAFAFAAALSVIAVVLLSGIYEPARGPAPRRHPLQEIKEGVVFVLHHPLLRPVFITQFIFNTASFLLLAVFVPYAVRRLGLSATGVGTTLAMYGVGMVVGALSATRVMRRLPFGTVIGLGPVTGFAAAAVMALTTIVPSPALAGLSFFLLGVGPILWVISTTTLRQSVTPPSLLGRVSAINIMSYGARPVGSALGAIVGGLYSAEACIYLAVAIFAAQALVILMSPAVALARQPDMVGEAAKC
jgi:predicted MFS family arabinose efflux permease